MQASGPYSKSRVGRSWTMPLWRVPRVPTVHPMASVGTRANTRHERRVTYAPAGQQPQGRGVPRGGSLGDTTIVKSVGRPLIVTAGLSGARKR
jgi:hypothetical protein